MEFNIMKSIMWNTYILVALLGNKLLSDFQAWWLVSSFSQSWGPCIWIWSIQCILFAAQVYESFGKEWHLGFAQSKVSWFHVQNKFNGKIKIRKPNTKACNPEPSHIKCWQGIRNTRRRLESSLQVENDLFTGSLASCVERAKQSGTCKPHDKFDIQPILCWAGIGWKMQAQARRTEACTHWGKQRTGDRCRRSHATETRTGSLVKP